jgi:uncharacterized protein YjbJ (UPF0337 family)
MNWDEIEGKWKEMMGRAKETWGRLTHRDLAIIRGERDQLVGKIQQIYGLAKKEAERQVAEFGRNARLKRVRLVIKRTVRRISPLRSKPSSASADRIASKTPRRPKKPLVHAVPRP